MPTKTTAISRAKDKIMCATQKAESSLIFAEKMRHLKLKKEEKIHL